MHTIRAVGAVTEALCAVRVGDAIGVRGPFGTAWPLEEAEGRDVVIVAGGIGLAPLRPAIYHVLANRERYGGVAIVYGGRSPEELLYASELERWRARFDVSVHVTVDAAAADWRGRVGVVTTLLPRITFDPDNVLAMLVGPVLAHEQGPELAMATAADGALHAALERDPDRRRSEGRARAAPPR